MPTSLFALLAAMNVLAGNDQTVVHQCDFNSGIPSDYAVYDLDAQTHHYTMVQAGIDQGVAWTDLREKGSSGNRYAASTSKYKGNEVRPADDWLVTPRMRIMSADAVISWRAQSLCENSKKGDTYEVRVSTSGNRPEDFVDEPVALVEQETVNQWTLREADLGRYAGQDVYIAFVNRSEMCEILAIDDICVKSGHGAYEVRSAMQEYVFGSETQHLAGVLHSNTLDGITSFTACCKVNGKEYRREYTGVNVNAGEDFYFEFEESFEVPYGDTLRYQIWADVEGYRADTLTTHLVTMLFDAKRRTVFEEGTGMWCGYCPLGIIAIDRLKEKYPDDFIPIAVHYDDALEVDGYSRELYFSSFPIAWVNRKYETVPMVLVETENGMDYTMGSGGFETALLDEQAKRTFAEVHPQASMSDQEVTVEVETRFAVSRQGVDFRLAFVVVEDHVEGDKFYQANYLNMMPDYSLDGFNEMDDYIRPFVFQDVARDVAGNYKGIPASTMIEVKAGETYRFRHTFTVDNVSDPANARVVVMLLDYATGHVVNAAQTQMTVTGIHEVKAPSEAGQTLYDLSGRPVKNPVSKGIYLQGGKKVMWR